MTLPLAASVSPLESGAGIRLRGASLGLRQGPTIREKTMNKRITVKKAISGMVFTVAGVYTATLGLMVGFDTAEANSMQFPSSLCHAATDDVGTNLLNSGAMTYNGTGTKSIYCPQMSLSGFGKSNAYGLNIYGYEGTDGSNSRTCRCFVSSAITCNCGTATSWTNNANGLVASNVDTYLWDSAPDGETLGYTLHSLTTGSSLAGEDMTF